MKRKIDFIVSVAGQDTIVIPLEYDESPIPDEIKDSPYNIMEFVWAEAKRALTEEIGHDDYEISWWQWLK